MGEVSSKFWINPYVNFGLKFFKLAKIGLAFIFSEILAYKLAYCSTPSTLSETYAKFMTHSKILQLYYSFIMQSSLVTKTSGEFSFFLN